SFFMVIIPILGEAILDMKKIIAPSADALAVAPQAQVGATAMIVGFMASFIVGCLACKWMLDIVKKGKMIWFAVYCLIVGLICIICH
ncbi:MAG: UDP-diphosphatase, partial [Muribaculaceae bacterium]|nr:UDP-diphosphatase [Muribaculaceae bacterium]